MERRPCHIFHANNTFLWGVGPFLMAVCFLKWQSGVSHTLSTSPLPCVDFTVVSEWRWFQSIKDYISRDHNIILDSSDPHVRCQWSMHQSIRGFEVRSGDFTRYCSIPEHFGPLWLAITCTVVTCFTPAVICRVFKTQVNTLKKKSKSLLSLCPFACLVFSPRWVLIDSSNALEKQCVGRSGKHSSHQKKAPWSPVTMLPWLPLGSIFYFSPSFKLKGDWVGFWSLASRTIWRKKLMMHVVTKM